MTNIKNKIGILGLVCVLILANFAGGNHTSAAALAMVSVRFDRLKTSAASTGTVCARPATLVAVEAEVVVTYPSGYTLGTAGTFTVDTTNKAWPSGGTAWPGIGTATAVAGQAVTFPSNDLTMGTLYCFNWINSAAVAIKATATGSNSGSVQTNTIIAAPVDSATYSTTSIANDQIVVSATVSQTFNFSINNTLDSLGSLTSSGISSSPTPRTATVNTNALNGWIAWAQDANTGLNSASAAKTIASTTPGISSTLVAGSEGYNTGVTSTSGGGSGTISVAAPFTGGSSGKGSGLNTSFATIATANGTAVNHTLSLTNNATITGSTPAGTDYTDTITVVGAGLF